VTASWRKKSSTTLTGFSHSGLMVRQFERRSPAGVLE
jgi:hypothetical protein